MNTVSIYHTFDICLEIANKLRNPEQVCEFVQESAKRGHFISDHWIELSLAEGLPGIAAFYGILDLQFPNEGWDHVAYSYLKLTIDKIEEKGISNVSLHGGLSGICLAAHLCSRNGSRYQKLLANSEDLLFKSIENSLFNQIDQVLDKDLHCSPKLYSLSDGISGLLGYLLMRKEDVACCKLAKDCLRRLVSLLERNKVVKENLVPGWYITSEDQINPNEREKYPNGSFSLGMPFGILGCLSILSLAYIEGVIIPGQIEVINRISTWLKGKQGVSSSGPYWNHTLSFEEEILNQYTPPNITRDAWHFGTPIVSRSLFLAGKALGDSALMTFAEESFVSIFSKTWQEWHLFGGAFDAGRAGLLALTHHMAKETGNPLLIKQVDILEQDLKRFYHPNHPFGFQTIHFLSEDQLCWVDHPGLINGSIGMALALLLAQSDHEMNWSRIFLIK